MKKIVFLSTFLFIVLQIFVCAKTTNHEEIFYVHKGASKTLSALDGGLQYSSTGDAITVDSAGKVTGVSVGTGTVTGKDPYGTVCEK